MQWNQAKQLLSQQKHPFTVTTFNWCFQPT
jgi:hypothetical protein